MHFEPLISICIPTYNRAEILKNTIDSIVSQDEFLNTNNIELVVCDNASDDDTELVCKYFIKLFPQKFKYYKNSNNIGDKNFEKVLSLGKGTYLKLNNDTLQHKSGSLLFFTKNLNIFLKENTLLLFNPVNTLSVSNKDINSLDEFVDFFSFWLTWIPLLGLTKIQFDRYRSVFIEYSDTHLSQLAVLLKAASENKLIILNNSKYLINTASNRKSGYDFIKVFLINYIRILSEYLDKKLISKKTISNQKKKVIFQHILPSLTAQIKGYNDDILTFENRSYLIIRSLLPDFKFIIKYLFFEWEIQFWKLKKVLKIYIMITYKKFKN
jgi:abequosyltransferase